MKILFAAALLSFVAQISISASSAPSGVYDFTMKSIDGKPASFAAYKGKVLLLVNVASQCGFTPQYAGLEKLYQTYKGRGLVIVGIPANNFGGQEPGSDAEIQQFCSRTYQVTFPMMSKVSVAGSDKTALYTWLTNDPKTKGEIKWNFTKFLIDRTGHIAARFESAVEPDSSELQSAVQSALSH